MDGMNQNLVQNINPQPFVRVHGTLEKKLVAISIRFCNVINKGQRYKASNKAKHHTIEKKLHSHIY